ncbi:MAG: guanine permease [Desulfobacteraceae bacterium 4572_35.1]|nr:MAG: guanine permease [Desulfobacteraceae bacterium 4572_35.1]
MKDFFELEKRGTTVKREFVGGLTTFLTMAYIVFVNPDILSQTGMDKGALITATCLAGAIGTLIVALWVKAPMAMAPGMGLNAFFTYSLVLPHENVTWEMALGVVFLSGIFFLFLTISKIRQKIINAIPDSLRLAVGAGIGLFITFIGMKNMGLITAHPATLVTLGEFTQPVVLGLVGLIVIVVLETYKVRGSLLIGIVTTYVLGLTFGEISLSGSLMSMPPSLSPIAFKLDILGALQLSLVGAIFSFMFVDLFDSVGTIVACSYQADMVEKDGSIQKIDKMLEADAIATVAGSLLGTSTTTTYVESASGIADGARTGLASLFTALFFICALFFAPFIGSVPSFATSPALIVVGAFMFRLVRQIDIANFEVAIPTFLTIIMMPLTYSISNGISMGFLAHIVVSVAGGKVKTISPILWIVAALSLLNLLYGV